MTAKNPSGDQTNNPLHGVTIAHQLTYLIEEIGWEEMAEITRIRCFSNNPTYKSSLKFIRKTPWAKEKVERLYLSCIAED